MGLCGLWKYKGSDWLGSCFYVGYCFVWVICIRCVMCFFVVGCVLNRLVRLLLCSGFMIIICVVVGWVLVVVNGMLVV